MYRNNKIRLRNNTIRLLVLLSVLFLWGCDDFVEISQPNAQLTTDAVFENATTANAAMADVYAQMRENGMINGKSYGLSVLLGAYADELVSYENGPYSTANFYQNTLLASNDYVSALWNSSYNQIYAANAIFEGVSNSASLAAADKTQLTGEALFVRAFTHFYLVNIFGDVPYITTTNYVHNSTVSRMPTETVYQNIISDLQTAISLLPANYVQPDRTRPNKATAQALLARVYLYHGDFVQAENTASTVLNNPEYDWEDNLDNTFLKESTATIWQLSAGIEGANTYEGTTFIFYSGPPYLVGLSDDFVNQFEASDLRKTHWIKQVTDGSTVWHHPYKYKQGIPTASSLEYSIVFRMAEQYLIRAEARAKIGDLVGAKADIDKIRNTAGLGNTAANFQTEVLDAIALERQHELFTEHGHRFFDLKRWGKLDNVLNSKPGWNTNDQLWPLPQSELQVNPFLAPQNPGY